MAIVDGRQIAENIYARLEQEGALAGKRLGIVCCEPNAVIESFVRIKSRAAQRLGVELVRKDVPASAREQGIMDAVREFEASAQGIIVQLPIPAGFAVGQVLAAIPGAQDVDGIGPDAQMLPPVARAVREILMSSDVSVLGKRAVVIGAGRLVGGPCARMLEAEGAQVTVLQKGDSLDALAAADIVVSGAGEPGLVQPGMLEEGVVLIDAGTSEQGGKVRGDADPSCAERCSVFTPVPGGVGPVAVAMIFENLNELTKENGPAA